MPMSEYLVYQKSMDMLVARESLESIRSSNFSNLSKADQKTVWGDLKKQSTIHMVQKLKDFRAVAANLARKMMNGRR
jgi:hypothetical protein